MPGRSDVCVLLPTLNEAATVQAVIDGFLDVGFEHILVIDGGSNDNTQTLAAQSGATVVEQSGSGKGQAVREAVDVYIDEPYVLIADADGTYRPEDAAQILDPLINGKAEHVIGDRFAGMQPGAMSRLNRTGNRMLNQAFTLIHGRNLRDILSGYRGFTRASFERMSFSADGFGIETEMAVESVKLNIRTAVVGIEYHPRPTESSTNLRPLRDGTLIGLTLYRLAKTNNPLFYFGSVGLLSTLFGSIVAFYVGYRWFMIGISHEVLAVVAAFGLIFGVQLVMFGFLSDMIVTLHREQMERIEDQNS